MYKITRVAVERCTNAFRIAFGNIAIIILTTDSAGSSVSRLKHLSKAPCQTPYELHMFNFFFFVYLHFLSIDF